MDQIKKQASSFIQDKYRSARMALTDVTEAEVLTEEATNGDLCSPDAKTMTRIAEASYGINDYWRIVDVLHRRLNCVDWKKWRQSYKSLIVLEFLLTHGPEDFAEEFVCDTNVIMELGTFRYIDDNGFNWGANMLTKSKDILRLLGGEKEVLREARFRALRVSKEIQGFGSSLFVPPFSLTHNSSSSSSESSSLGSFSTNNLSGETTKIPQISLTKEGELEICALDDDNNNNKNNNNNVDGLRNSDHPIIQKKGSTVEGKEEYQDDDNSDDYCGKSRDGFVGGIFSKLTSFTTPSRDNKSGFRSISDVGNVTKKKLNRQFSLWY